MSESRFLVIDDGEEILPVSWHWGRQGTRHDSWFKRIMVGRDWSSLSLLDIRSSLSTCFTLYYSFLMLIYYHAHNSSECNQTCANQKINTKIILLFKFKHSAKFIFCKNKTQYFSLWQFYEEKNFLCPYISGLML